MSASPVAYTSAYGSSSNGNGNDNDNSSDPRKRKRARQDIEEGPSNTINSIMNRNEAGRSASPPAGMSATESYDKSSGYASTYGRTAGVMNANANMGQQQDTVNYNGSAHRASHSRTSASPAPLSAADSTAHASSPINPANVPSSISQQQQQQQNQARRNAPRPINKNTLEPSYFVVEPNDEFTREVGDWIWGWIADRTDVEIEGKIGILVDNRPGLPPKTRVSFPLATETILTDTTFARFESNMTLRQHHHFNQILNMRATEAAQPNYSGAPIRYLHTKEIDAFYPSSSIPHSGGGNSGNGGGNKARVRVTRDQKTRQVKNDPKACVRKSRISDMNVYSPKRGFDFRISVNVEEPAPHPSTKPTHERWKDRVSYQHQAFQIDLTQVRSTDGKELLHELEIEFSDMPLLMQEGAKAARGEESIYYDLVQVFLNNIRMLVRNASPP